MNVYSIDFKNVMITLRDAGTNGRRSAGCSQTFVAMRLMCVAVLFIHLTAPIQAHPPLLYLTIVPSTYVLAMTSGKGKAA